MTVIIATIQVQIEFAKTMVRAFILGISISCLLLGIECLGMGQIRVQNSSVNAGSDPTVQTESPIAPAATTDIAISPLLAWLLIGLGSSTVFYTLLNGSSAAAGRSATGSTSATNSSVTTTTPHSFTGQPSRHSPTTTDASYYDAAWEHEDDFDTDQYENDSSADEEESEPEFDIERFQREFDIDALLDESA